MPRRIARYLFASTVLLATAQSSLAHAQRTPEEWLEQHHRDTLARAREPGGAVPLLRLWAQRDWVHPGTVLDRLHNVSSAAALPMLRRSLALFLEADVHFRLGQANEASEALSSLGFITRWQVIGPFDNEGRNGFLRAYGPETDRGAPIDTSHPYDGRERPVRWRTFPELSRRGYVALDAMVRPTVNSCAYAHTTMTARAEAASVLWLGASGQVRVWWNGAEVYRDEALRGAFPDRAGVALRLRRGANRLLLKVCNESGELGFYARVTRPDGGALANVSVDAEPSLAPTQAITTGDPRFAPALGVFAELRTAADRANPTPAALEEYARYLAATRSDNSAQPIAADVAERAANAQPTWTRWLLVAELSRDRNRRLRAIERASALAPNEPAVLVARGHEAARSGNLVGALDLFDRALSIDDAYLPARLERASVLNSQGLSLLARRELEEAALRAPHSVEVLWARQRIAEAGLQWDEADALRAQYLRLRSDDVAAREMVASAARQRGDRDTVRREAGRLIALRPDRLGLYRSAAQLLESAGDGDGALGVLTRAVEIAPDDSGLWVARGELEVRLGQRDQGRVSLRQGLALAPQNASLRQFLEALEPPVPRADEALAEASEVFLRRRVSQAQTQGYRLRGLQELVARTVYPNGLSGMFRQSVYQVLSTEGAESARSFPIQFDPGTQRFELRLARVYHPDGSVDESAGLQEYALTGGASRMYFDSRAAVVTFPRLSPGDVVEVRWRVDDISQRNAFADYFGDLQVVQAEWPRVRYQYFLRAPAARQLYFHVPELTGLQRNERQEGNDRVYDFVAQDVPAVPPEDHAPGITERGAYLHVSTYRTWEEVGRWYWGLIQNQFQADDRVRQIVREATRNANTPRERVRAIYNWVIHNTRYVALEFGIHGFLPYRVPEVCSRGFGDCKDKASTIVTMLREVGIDASIVLVRTRNNGAVATSPASLAVFDHAIAYVPPMEGYPEGIFLDGTAQQSGMDELPFGDQGAMVLIVNQRGEARLTTIPVYPAERNQLNARSELTVDATGRGTLHVTQESQGPSAGGVRNALEAEATRAERIEQGLAAAYGTIRVTNVRTGDLTDRERPARVEYDATLQSVARREGNALVLAPLPPLNLSREFAGRSTRTADVILGVTQQRDERRTIRLPAGASQIEVPANERIDSPFVRLEFTSERQGNTITVRRVYSTLVDRVPAARYAEFRTVCQRIDEALNRRISFHVP